MEAVDWENLRFQLVSRRLGKVGLKFCQVLELPKAIDKTTAVMEFIPAAYIFCVKLFDKDGNGGNGNGSQMRETIRNFLAPVETILVRQSALVALISVVLLGIAFSVFTVEDRGDGTIIKFLTGVSLSNVITFTAVLGIIVIGVAILMIVGEFDLSVGSAFAVVGFTFGVLVTEGGLNVWLAAAISIVVGSLLGLFNGTIVVKSGTPSFIITLGTLLAFRGIARAIGGGTVVSYSPDEEIFLFTILNSSVDGLNGQFMPAGNFRTSILWFLGLALVLGFFLHRTRLGNWIFATGGNRAAAQAQGVATNRVKITAFVLVGTLVAIAAVINFSERNSVDPLTGSLWELLAVAACVMGGLRLRGGYGTIVGACLGILMISILNQGLVLVGLSTELFRAVLGGILIVIATLNQYLSRTSST